MYLFGFKGRAERVLIQHFAYPLNSLNAPIFAGICRQAKSFGANEYDAAILFMLVQMNALTPHLDSIKAQSFIEEKSERMSRIAYKSSRPSQEWVQTLNEIRERHGLSVV